MVLNSNDWHFRPDSLRGDPAEVGELGENVTSSRITRVDFPNVTLEQLMDEVQRVRGLTRPPDQVDVAEFLLDQGATPEHMAQFFDPISMQTLSDAGIINRVPTALSQAALDPAVGGELDVPEFAQRFADATSHGIRRRWEDSQKGYVSGAEPAFPVEAMGQLQQKWEESSTSVGQPMPDVKLADWTPPVATGALRFAGEKIQDWEGSGNETLKNLAETATADEVNTAPAFFSEPDKRYEYIEEFGARELNKAREKFAEGDVGQGLAHFFGGVLGGMGRFRDSIAAEVQVAGGQAMARAMLQGWDSFDLPDLPLMGGLADPQSFEFPEKDREILERIANLKLGEGFIGSSDEEAVQLARDLFNRNAGSHPYMIKGLLENSLTLAVEIQIPGPKILSGPVKMVARRIPFMGHAEAAVRKLKGKTWDRLSERKKLKATYTADQRIRLEETNIDSLTGNILAVAKDSEDAVSLMELLARPGHAGSVAVQELLKRLNNSHLSMPTGPFMRTLRRIKGSEKSYKADGVTLTNEARAARADLAKNGWKASEKTLRLYDSDDPPPLPFNMGDQLDMFRTPPPSGHGQWSPALIIERVKSQLVREIADAEGYNGPVLWVPFLKKGNTNPVRWLSMQTKAQVGYAWLFMRGGFAPLNALGGAVPMTQQQGWKLARARIAHNWLQRVAEGGHSLDHGLRRILEKNVEDATGYKNYGRELDTMLGPRARDTGSSRIAGYMTGQDVSATGIPGVPQSLLARLPIVGKNLVGDWRTGVGTRFDTEELLPWEVPFAEKGGKLSKIAQQVNRAGGAFLTTQRDGRKWWQRVPGVGGVVSRAVSGTERTQHFIMQEVVLEQVAKREFAEAAAFHGKNMGVPDSVLRKLVSEFNKASAIIWNEDVLRGFLSETGQRLRAGYRVSDAPQDFIPAVVDSTVNTKLRNQLLDLGPEADGAKIRIAADVAAKKHIAEAQRLVDEIFDAFPSLPGKGGNDLLRVYRETGAPVDSRTFDLIATHRMHDIELSAIQTGLMDVLSRRLVNFSDATSETVGDLLEGVAKKFEDARYRQSQAHWEIVGKYQRALSETKDSDMIRRSGREYQESLQELHQRTAKEFEAIADEITGDEMIDAYDALLREASEGTGATIVGTCAEKNLQQARQALREVQTGFVTDDGIRVPGITEVNKTYALARNKARKLTNLDERSNAISRANKGRIEAIRDTYNQIAARHVIDPMPELRLDAYLSESDWIRALREVDAKKVAEGKSPKLENAFLEDDIGRWILDKAQREHDQILEAGESTAEAWEAPPALQFDDAVLDADEIIDWRNSAMSMGRQVAEGESNRGLFSYVYNRPEVALQAIFPYPYWQMKFAMFQARQSLSKPGQLHILADLYYDWMAETEDLPPHLQQTVRVFTTADGREWRFDPMSMLGGSAYAAPFTLLKEGTDPELNQETLGMFKLVNLLNVGSVHPWIAALTHKGIEQWGVENAEEMLGERGYRQLFGPSGIAPPIDENASRILGSTQQILMNQFAQRISPEAMYTHGLKQQERHVIGYMIAEAIAAGELDQEAGMQAIIDLQQNVENPDALAAMIKYFQRKDDVKIANWTFGGLQTFDPPYKESIEVQNQYNQLRAEGRDSEADAWIKAHPELPARWMIWKDLPEQQQRLNTVKYYADVDDLNVERQTALDATAITDVEKRREIRDTFLARTEELKVSLGLTNEMLGFDTSTDPDTPTGKLVYGNKRTDAIKGLVSTFYDSIKPEDYRDGKDTNLEGYYLAQENWKRKYVTEGMRAEFEAELSKNISALDALYRTLYELSFEKFWEATAGESREIKEQWIVENPPPSAQELARATVKRYPHRSWVKTDDGDDADTATNVSYLINKVADGDLSIRGYLDRRYPDKIARLRRTGEAFTTPSGLQVNEENIGEFAQALEDYVAYNEDHVRRKAFNHAIDAETEKYQDELRALSPTDFAVGKDDGIRMKYLGKDGKHGTIGIFKRVKELLEDNQTLAKWTDAANKWFGREDGLTTEDILREMSSLYREVVPNQFLGSDGVDWDAYNTARDTAFQEAVAFGSVLGGTEQELNEYLMKDRVPAETAWRYWQETYIQPALDRRNELKDAQGRISLTDHNRIEAEFNRSPKVSEIVSDIIKKYPHLKRVDFTEIMEARLPSFGEYWQLRGYSKPKAFTPSARAGQIRGSFDLPQGATYNPFAPQTFGEELKRLRTQQ